MRRLRVYSPQALASGETVLLDGAPAHHLLRVLRRRVGDSVVLFNGDGQEHGGEIVALDGRDGCTVALTSSARPATESPLRTTLIQAIGRGDRMDWAVQKCVELGVHAIQPVLTERTEVRLQGPRAEKRRAHWQQIVISACEQSGRVRVPEVAPIIQLDELPACRGTALYLEPTAIGDLASLTLDPDAEVALAIGPEGGFSTDELARLDSLGFTGLRLGPRVLRTETAGAAVLAALQFRFGDC
jgi:16S rRNA (uracil1498-N3)-methyltransferase